MIDIREHGGSYGGGGDIVGRQTVKVFVQLTTPTAINVGDIWVKTSANVGNISFRDFDTSPVASEGVVKLGETIFEIDISNMEPKVQLADANDSKLVYDYYKKIADPTITEDFLKIWENSIQKVFTKYGSFKYWDTSDGKWKFVNADYWDGSKWVTFSFSNFTAYVGIISRAWPIDPDGNVGSLLQGPGTVTSMAVNETNLFIAEMSKVSKLDKLGNIIWTATPTSYTLQPCIALDREGNIFTANADSNMYKINSSGSLVTTLPKITTQYVYNTKIDTAGNRFYNLGNATLVKTSPAGEILWSKALTVYFIALDASGDVFYTSNQGKFGKIDGSTGNTVFERQISEISSLAIHYIQPYSDHIIIGNSSGKFFKYSLDGITQIWSKTVAAINTWNVASDPNGNTYICEDSGNKIHKYDTDGLAVFSISYPYINPIRHIVVEPGDRGVFPDKW